jgi:hypothetical protein
MITLGRIDNDAERLELLTRFVMQQPGPFVRSAKAPTLARDPRRRLAGSGLSVELSPGFGIRLSRI